MLAYSHDHQMEFGKPILSVLVQIPLLLLLRKSYNEYRNCDVYVLRDNGYFSGSGLESHTVSGNRLQYNTVSTSYTSGGINTSLGYADYANGVFNGWNKAPTIYAGSVTATGSLYVPAFGSTRRVSVRTVTISGNVYNILTV